MGDLELAEERQKVKDLIFETASFSPFIILAHVIRQVSEVLNREDVIHIGLEVSGGQVNIYINNEDHIDSMDNIDVPDMVNSRELLFLIN